MEGWLTLILNLWNMTLTGWMHNSNSSWYNHFQQINNNSHWQCLWSLPGGSLGEPSWWWDGVDRQWLPLDRAPICNDLLLSWNITDPGWKIRVPRKLAYGLKYHFQCWLSVSDDYIFVSKVDKENVWNLQFWCDIIIAGFVFHSQTNSLIESLECDQQCSHVLYVTFRATLLLEIRYDYETQIDL